MDLYDLILCLIAGFIAALPVIICQYYFYNTNYKYPKYLRFLLFFSMIAILWSVLTLLYLYFVFNNIAMGQFFPIIKIIEIFIPIIISISLYKDSYNIYNYMGFVSALIAIILISQISI